MTRRDRVLVFLVAAQCAVVAVDVGEVGFGEREVTSLNPVTWAAAAVPLALCVDWVGVWGALSQTVSLRFLQVLGAWAAVIVLFAPSPGRALAATAAFGATAGGVVDLATNSRHLGEFEHRVALIVLQSWLVFVGLSVLAWAVGGADVIRDSRLALAAPEANHLARFGALVAVAGIYLAFTHPRRSLRGAAILLALSGLLSVVASDSRTATVAVFIGGVVLIARFGHPRAALAALGTASLAIGALVAAGLFGSLADGLRRTAEDPTANILAANGRSEIWAPILEAAGNRWFLGSALGSDRQLMLELYGTGRIDWRAEHTHSLVLHLLVVVGLPGLLLLLGSVVGAYPHLIRSTRLIITLLVVVVVGGVSEAALSAPEIAWAATVAGLASTLLLPARPHPAPTS